MSDTQQKPKAIIAGHPRLQELLFFQAEIIDAQPYGPPWQQGDRVAVARLERRDGTWLWLVHWGGNEYRVITSSQAQATLVTLRDEQGQPIPAERSEQIVKNIFYSSLGRLERFLPEGLT